MASIRDLYKDPFEKHDLLMQRINRMAYIGEATSAVSKMSGLSLMRNVDYFNSMNSALGILQQRMDEFANPNMNLLGSMDTVAQRLSEFNKFQPGILSALERVCDHDSRIAMALHGSSSLISSSFEINFTETLSQLTAVEALGHIHNLKTIIPCITNVLEELNDSEPENSLVVEETVPVGKKDITAKSIKVYIEYLAAIVTILDFLFTFIHSTIPETNMNITNNHSTNYYIQQVNNYYANEDEFYAEEYNSNKYRFVAEKEVTVRIKADYSSAAVEKLKLGKIVQIVDKYKKWVQIRWKNEDDTYSYGWIQNYKT